MSLGKRKCRVSLKGLTLIELLVSMVLGILLSGGIVGTYMSAKRNALYEEQMARMQESGRYAMRLLSRELMMSGFFGGLPIRDGLIPASVGVDCSDQRWALDESNSLDMVNDYFGQSLPKSLNSTRFTCLDTTSIQLNTDLLSIKRTAGEASLRYGVPLNNLTASTGDNWYLQTSPTEPPKWEKLRAVDLIDGGGIAPFSSYWEAISRVYFIRRYSDSSDQHDNIPTLCLETLAGNGMTLRCLIEGVEDLQFEFGIDTDADGVPNQYKSAPVGEEMQHAVTARIHLLLRSINTLPGYLNTATYAVGPKIVAAQNDAYARQVMSSTVLLRNQIRPVEL